MAESGSEGCRDGIENCAARGSGAGSRLPLRADPPLHADSGHDNLPDRGRDAEDRKRHSDLGAGEGEADAHRRDDPGDASREAVPF